ncbi:MAG: VCBS repeat-containing protein [Bacteroidetes bacterium]|nr:VCBS repeat-containing protein [Bacteroidota bacterium]
MRLFTFKLKGFSLLLFSCLLLVACKQEDTGFVLLMPKDTGVQFANTITEKDTMNILDMEFVYNGGGVGIGDVNGDGLEDLYFTGNQVGNQLYLNKGNLKFEDITEAAGVQKTMPYQWSSGVNMLDINLDGRLDIYVCNTINPDPEQRRNLLFINQGNDVDGTPHFKEMGKEYGADDDSHSSHAQFFDYDNDGDLDLFIGVNFIDQQYPNQFVTRTYDGSSPTSDKLFENNWSDSLGHPVFTDVSLKAGIVLEGYSHSTLVCDFNDDGWQDIFVANDYQSNDILFINNGTDSVGSRQLAVGSHPTGTNQSPTFTNRIADIFKHQSLSSMGSDVADFNNDGRPDIFTTEMQPYYNKRKKLFQGGSSYQRYIFTEQYHYEYQYTRNALQMNLGMDPETRLPVFADVGMFAGVQETDWSWSSVFADFDNDGLPDLYVANGFPRDVTDHDFGDFRKSIASTLTPKHEMYAMIPEVKSPNFMFKNDGGLTFSDVTSAWGLGIRSFSNGAAYGDLDNDGDLDLVTNNIDDPAFIFENKANPSKDKKKSVNYLNIKLKGAAKNPDAFGASAAVFYEGKKQRAWLLSARGYLSKSENAFHFGLGNTAQVDSLVVTWPDRRRSVLKNVAANQTLNVSYETGTALPYPPPSLAETLFDNLSGQLGLGLRAAENDYIDFNFQRTLPHKLSQYGPSLACGDVNGDGLDDIFVGGSSRYDALWLLQKPDGSFSTKTADYKSEIVNKEEDTGSLLFDADNDGDLDLYIVRGSGQWPVGDPLYQDVLCVNDGQGNFKTVPAALPKITANGSCVKAADFDADGDLDLFVGSRVLPKHYPMPDRCYLLRNDSSPQGGMKFTDVTEDICPELVLPGLISDALWTDFNGDNQPDLLLAGEWMPLRFFQNVNGKLIPKSEIVNPKSTGWWNSLAAADLDNDGDVDYVAGNFGENLYFRCTDEHPLRVYAKDFDGNSDIDPFISCYWKDSLGVRREYFYHPREDVIKQWPGFRKKYVTFGEYGEATVQDIFTPKELEGATILAANWMKTSVLENLGNGKFRLQALPTEAQLAPVYGILPSDVNDDGLLDLLLVGNDYGMELQQGRADAFTGLVLLNRGRWNFSPMDMESSNFIVRKDARSIVSVPTALGRELVIASQSADSLRVFTLRKTVERQFFPVKKEEVRAVYTLADGTKRAEEFYWGSTFMAQRPRYVTLGGAVQSVALYDRAGQMTRKLKK